MRETGGGEGEEERRGERRREEERRSERRRRRRKREGRRTEERGREGRERQEEVRKRGGDGEERRRGDVYCKLVHYSELGIAMLASKLSIPDFVSQFVRQNPEWV